MNKFATGIVIMASVLLTACSGSDTPETDKSIVPAADTNKTVAAPADASVTPQQGTADAGAKVQTIPATQPATALPGAGLNPAHGEPGHRCDISVGAPLNSAPSATSAPAPQPQVVTTASQPITAPATTTPANPNAKLNPAHGQPGHDCSIAVGAPLKG